MKDMIHNRFLIVRWCIWLYWWGRPEKTHNIWKSLTLSENLLAHSVCSVRSCVGYVNVLGQHWMELTFLTAAHIALCSSPVARTELVLYQCFGYCLTMVAQNQGCFSNSSRLRVGKKWWVDIVRTADLNWLKRYSILYDIMLSNKNWGGKKEK